MIVTAQLRSRLGFRCARRGGRFGLRAGVVAGIYLMLLVEAGTAGPLARAAGPPTG
jgi:hypothetical protein